MYSHTYETNLFIHQKTQQENFNFSYIALCQVLFCTFSQITTQLLPSDGIFFPFGPDSDIVLTSQWSQVDLLLYTHIRTPAIHTFKSIAIKTCFWSGLLFTLSRIKTKLQQNVVFFLTSNIKKDKYRPATTTTPVALYVTLRLPPLDSDTGWTGELWSKTNLLKWLN